MRVLAVDYSQLQHPPKFGPLPGEKTIERYNRAWMLLRVTTHFRIPTTRKKWGDAQYHNNDVAVPRFMSGLPATGSGRVSEAATQQSYLPFNFQLSWLNAQAVRDELIANGGEGDNVKAGERRMPDIRVSSGDQWRDDIRRHCDMRRLNIDIGILEVSNLNGTDLTTDCITDFEDVQKACQEADVERLRTFKFTMRTTFVPADQEIYESPMPAGLEVIYSINDNNTITRREPEVDATEPPSGTSTNNQTADPPGAYACPSRFD
jgi:hypothetical protein